MEEELALPYSPTWTEIIKPMFLLNFLRVWEFVFNFDEHLLPRNCCNAWGLTVPTGVAPGTINSTLKKPSGISSPCCYRHTLRCHLQTAPALPGAVALPLFPMTSITPPFFFLNVKRLFTELLCFTESKTDVTTSV